MAELLWTDLQKNSKITVTIDDVLPDILVVSFFIQGKIFQGVLLDSTKKLLPCGIVAPAYEIPPLGTATPPVEDKLFSASQRYSYFQEKAPHQIERIQLKRSIKPPARFKNSRMTVRLRPRQVLCSKCRGICNENSENVDLSSKKRKGSEKALSPPPKVARPDRRLRSSGEISPRPVFPDNPRANPKKNSHSEVPQSKKRKLCASLVPKFSPLPNSEPENHINGRVQKIKIVGNYWVKEESKDRGELEPECVSVEDEKTEKVEAMEEDPLSLVDQPEEPCAVEEKTTVDNDEITVEDDPCVEEEADPLDLATSQPHRVLRKKRSVGSMEDLWDENVFEEAMKAAGSKAKTPVIKISFGSGTGEGTVLKIPAKPQNVPNENDKDDKRKEEKTKRDASAKAAKKALKKAKKEARRKMVGGSSPACSLGGTSPRYANLSPRYFAACMSPRQSLGNSSPAYEIFHKKHKHKVKHKKRHKEEKKHRDTEVVASDTATKEEIHRECLKQKLSINLKRLNSNAYMRCTSSSPSNSDASDEHSDCVPDFPGNPLMMRLSNQTMASCQTTDGRQMAVGDVVWGKIHGFPWWPGKVLSITVSRKEDGASTSPQAHVAWYGSSTSSLMSCDQLNPFLETFQVRYNKKKRGPYKEAIKQATTEARRGDSDIPTEVYSSPTAVDVAS